MKETKDKKYHILYETTNLINGMKYVGIHSTNNLNDRYLGSGVALDAAIIQYSASCFNRVILESFETRALASLAEREYVNRAYVARSDTYNIKIGGDSGRSDMITVKDIDGNTMSIFNDDPRWLSGELVGVQSGKVTVKDKDGNTLCVSCDDPRIASGELKSIHLGKVTVKDKDGNAISVSLDDERYLSGELVSIIIGTVKVKDEDGNILTISVDDPRYLSGELKHVSCGLVIVKDKDGNTMSVSVDDERYLSGELKFMLKGKITVKDKDGNIFQVAKDDPRYLSGELKFHWCGRKHSDETRAKITKSITGSKNWKATIIKIYDNDDNLMFTCDGTFKKVLKENHLPKILKRSYLNGGEKIYTNIPLNVVNRIKNNGFDKYIGWYAIQTKKER